MMLVAEVGEGGLPRLGCEVVVGYATPLDLRDIDKVQGRA